MVHQQLGGGGLADITKSEWFKKLWFWFKLQMDGASWESERSREKWEEKIQLCSIFRSPPWSVLHNLYLDFGFDKFQSLANTLTKG